MQHRLIGPLTVLSVLIFGVPAAAAADPTLGEQLRSTTEASKAQTPPQAQATMEQAIRSLRESGIVDKALKQGDKMPDFALPDANGKPVSSQELRKRGALVVTFYRGGWCPYCSLQLHDLQKHLAEFKAAGAELVAISPQTPDASLSTAQKQALQFHVLSDKGNKTAQAFGVSYKMPPDLIRLYKGFGLDLTQVNGTDDWELPLAATYVVTRAGRVAYAFVDADYTKRAETRDVVAAVKALRQ